MSLALALYRLATGIAEPLAPRILRGRAGRGKEDPARLSERLGHASRGRPTGSLVWIHGASVGESLSVLPLIERIRTERPDLSLLVTSGTVTSASLLAARLPPGVFHQYLPVDGPKAAARFLAHWKPQLAIFIESELWPNLLLQAKAQGARLALLSARITEESAGGWMKAPAAARAILGAFDLVMPQDGASADRLRDLGADPQGLLNLKFLAGALPYDPDARAALEEGIGDRPVILAASTHPGEEALIAAAIPEETLLIVAPRHPERGEAVTAALRGLGYKTARRAFGEPPTAETDIYVADTLGEMGLLYEVAQVAVMGGSFVEGIGGHNPLEPARAGIAVVTGPHTFNFAEVYGEMEGHRCVLLAEDGADLARLLPQAQDDWVSLGAAAADYAASRSVAMGEAWARLQPLLPR